MNSSGRIWQRARESSHEQRRTKQSAHRRSLGITGERAVMRLSIPLNPKPLVGPTAKAGEAMAPYARVGFSMPLDRDVRRNVRSTTHPWPGKTPRWENPISAVGLRGGNFKPPGIFILVHFWVWRMHQHNLTMDPRVSFCWAIPTTVSIPTERNMSSKHPNAGCHSPVKPARDLTLMAGKLGLIPTRERG